jgi:uncharacterized RDD family membrane protein YckC
MGDRLVAIVLETFLFAGFFATTGMVFAKRLGGLTDSGFSLEGTPALLAIFSTILLAFGYRWLCEGRFGATLGKGMIGILVQRKDGRACGFRASFIRNLMRLIDGIGFYLVGLLVALFSNSRQRLGDRLAGTVVVEERATGVMKGGLALLWLSLTGAGFIGAQLMHTAPTETRTAFADLQADLENPVEEAGVLTWGSMGLEATAQLRVINFEFLESKEGPSRDPSPYRPGDTLNVSFDIVEFTTDSVGRPGLSYDILVLDPAGLPWNALWKREFDAPLPAGAPVLGFFSLGFSPAVPSGPCNLVLTVRDELSGDEHELTAPFQVNAVPIPPATGLEIRDFSASISPDDPGTAIPEFQGAGTVYVSFAVFGLEFRDAETDARIGMAVLGQGVGHREGGRVLIRRDQSHVAKGLLGGILPMGLLMVGMLGSISLGGLLLLLTLSTPIPGIFVLAAGLYGAWLVGAGIRRA